MQPNPEERVYTFASAQLSEAQRQLWRDGRPIDLEPRIFDFLVHLLRKRDRVVSKQELIDVVWGGVVVGDAALARAASIGRKAVGSHGCIRTFYGLGYRFVAEVREQAVERSMVARPHGT